MYKRATKRDLVNKISNFNLGAQHWALGIRKSKLSAELLRRSNSSELASRAVFFSFILFSNTTAHQCNTELKTRVKGAVQLLYIIIPIYHTSCAKLRFCLFFSRSLLFSSLLFFFFYGFSRWQREQLCPAKENCFIFLSLSLCCSVEKTGTCR